MAPLGIRGGGGLAKKIAPLGIGGGGGLEKAPVALTGLGDGGGGLAKKIAPLGIRGGGGGLAKKIAPLGIGGGGGLEKAPAALGDGGGGLYRWDWDVCWLSSGLAFVEEKAKPIMASKTIEAMSNGFMAPSTTKSTILFCFFPSFSP
uniref:Uncharacterized protein n=1 Tax=Populus trichocarpa TaxID=3694 RepID=A0A2K2A5S4_POPTR